MTTVNDILKFLDELAPSNMKMEWDNVGLLCGSRKKPVEKILVALDPFLNVVQEAIERKADLIVTHHPLIFSATKSITDETETGRAIMLLIENGISAVNAHTNLDCAPGGVNDVLARALGLKLINVVDRAGFNRYGQPYGLLRMGSVPAQPLEDFLVNVKNALGCPGLRYVDGGKPVNKVAVGGGACASEIEAAFRAGCDTFVTADIKYNQFWQAKDLGMNLIDAGHFYTENPICAVLAEKIQAAFPQAEVCVAKNHTDCTKFFV